jgi:hypothetical protein
MPPDFEDSLANLATLMTMPPGLRRGNTQLLKPPPPASGGGYTLGPDPSYWLRPVAVTFTATMSGAGGFRSLALNYIDGDGFIFNQVPIAAGLGSSAAVTAYADLASVTPLPGPPTVSFEAQVTSPAAGATITSLTLPAGEWEIAWTVEVDLNGAAADDDNFGLYNGSNQVAQSVSGHTAGQPYPQIPVTVAVPAAGTTMNVKAIGAGTATSVYVASITATAIGGIGLQAQLPDLVLKQGWSLGISIGNVQAGDQLSNIGILVERYASNWADGALGQDREEELREWLARSGGRA